MKLNFERIVGTGHGGDIRTLLPAENRNKVGNVVQTQGPQFKELHYRLITGLPGMHRKIHCVGHIAEHKVNPLAQTPARLIEARCLSAAKR